MSAAARDAIATAANTVTGVTVANYYRQSLAPGEGFVQLVRRQRSDNGLGFMNTWQIWLAGPKDRAANEKFCETKLPLLMEAIDGEMIVQSAYPAEMVLGTNTVPGLIVEGVREG